MNRITLSIIAAAIAVASGASEPASLNSPAADGWLLRGELMFDTEIYNGTLDQTGHLRVLDPTVSQAEDAAYAHAMAAMHARSRHAVSEFSDFIAAYPHSARLPLAQTAIGDCYFSTHDYASALKAYQLVDPATLVPRQRSALAYRTAYCRLLAGDIADAAKAFGALKSDKRYGNAARFYLAYIAYDRGDYDRALSLFADVDRSSVPGNAVPVYTAQIYYARGNYDSALRDARGVTDNPSLAAFAPEARRIAGESLYNMGSAEQALPYLWKYAAEVAHPEPSALYILGASEYDAARYTEAIGLLQRAIAPENGKVAQSAYLYLGQAYSRTGNKNAALMAFEHAMRMDIDPKVTEAAFYNYTVAKMEGGRSPFADTSRLLQEFLDRFPGSEYASRIGEYMVCSYLRENDFEAALDIAERVSAPSASMQTYRQRALFMLGTRELANGAPRRALERFNKAAGGPDRALALQANLWKGDCLYALGQYEQAAASYTYFINHSQRDGENLSLARYDLGYAYFALERYGEAEREFREWMRIAAHPSGSILADACSRIADCRYYSGDYAQAESFYSHAVEAEPSKADYPLFQSALMKGLRRDHRGKIASIDRLTSTYPASALIPEALLAKAESQAAIGDNVASAATLEDIERRYPSTLHARKALLQLAITRMSMKRRSEAIDAYKKVIRTYPTSEEARLATDDLKRIYADDGALADFDKFLSSVPDAPRIDASEYDHLAFQAAEKSYISGGDIRRVEEYLTRYPGGAHEPQALYYLAMAANESGNMAKALEHASRITERYPHAEVAEDAMLMKAEAESELGRIDPAYKSYTALASRASTPDMQRAARLGVLRTAVALKRSQPAVEAADRLLGSSAAGETDIAEIRFLRGVALEQLGRHDEAETAWTDVITASPDDIYGARSAVALAEARLHRGHLTQARDGIERFINANPSDSYWLARGFIVLSDILRRQGETFEADEYLRTLRKNYPGSEADIFRMIDERLK